MASLLAVDAGLRTGLALYRDDGALLWARSQHLGGTAALRRAAHGLLRGIPDLAHVVVEGGGALAEVWLRAAEDRGVPARQVMAETWRAALLPERARRSGDEAKRHAVDLARRVLAASGAPRRTVPRHDAAEAVLVGLWAVRELGWTEASTLLQPGSPQRRVDP